MSSTTSTNKPELDNSQQQLQQIRIEKAESITRAKTLAKDHDRLWKEEILLLATILEKELLLLDQDWLVTNISEEISRIYRENNIRMWVHISDFLPNKYKLTPSQTPQLSLDSSNFSDISSETQPHQWGDVPQHSSSNTTAATTTATATTSNVVETLKNINHMVEDFPRDLIADIEYCTKQINQNCDKRAAAEHIALLEDTASTNKKTKGQDGQVTIDKPKPHGSLTYDALTRTIEDLKRVRDRVFEFPPEILEKDQEIAQGWDIWRQWTGPSLDLKYSKSWMDWFKTESYRDIYGKHAAAVMSFSLTNLCANCSDETTKEWVRMEPVYANLYDSYKCLICDYQMDTICPTCNLSLKQIEKPTVSWQCSECEGTVPLTRDLTREQVGDKSSIVMDKAIEIINHLPSNVAFCIWFSDWIEPYLGGRKTRLSDDLSEEA